MFEDNLLDISSLLELVARDACFTQHTDALCEAVPFRKDGISEFLDHKDLEFRYMKEPLRFLGLSGQDLKWHHPLVKQEFAQHTATHRIFCSNFPLLITCLQVAKKPSPAFFLCPMIPLTLLMIRRYGNWMTGSRERLSQVRYLPTLRLFWVLCVTRVTRMFLAKHAHRQVV